MTSKASSPHPIEAARSERRCGGVAARSQPNSPGEELVAVSDVVMACVSAGRRRVGPGAG